MEMSQEELNKAIAYWRYRRFIKADEKTAGHEVRLNKKLRVGKKIALFLSSILLFFFSANIINFLFATILKPLAGEPAAVVVVHTALWLAGAAILMAGFYDFFSALKMPESIMMPSPDAVARLKAIIDAINGPAAATDGTLIEFVLTSDTDDSSVDFKWKGAILDGVVIALRRKGKDIIFFTRDNIEITEKEGSNGKYAVLCPDDAIQKAAGHPGARITVKRETYERLMKFKSGV